MTTLLIVFILTCHHSYRGPCIFDGSSSCQKITHEEKDNDKTND